MPNLPRVSVLLTTYNGAGFVAQTIESVLTQTFGDFELVVVDDASTDDTNRVLARFSDSRMRVIRVENNLGVVGARNRAFAEARGEYIAAHDHDDLSLPERLARQVAYLDAHKEIVLVGTEIRIADAGRMRRPDRARSNLPLLMRWRCLVDNPLTYSSIMVRAAAVRRLGQYVREEFIYADDFDLYHRLLRIGDLGRLEEPLLIYRWHADNTSYVAGKTMNANAVKVLQSAYTALLGGAAEQEAILVVRHLSMRQPVQDSDTLHRIGAHLTRLMEAFTAAHAKTPDERAMVAIEAAGTWWRCVRAAVRSGGPSMLASYRKFPTLAASFRPSAADFLGSVGVGALRRAHPTARDDRYPKPELRRERVTHSNSYRLLPPAHYVRQDIGQQPRLLVVVDTEEGFDWDAPFGTGSRTVSSINQIHLVQSLFEKYRVLPTYVIDYLIATEESACKDLRNISNSGRCIIGSQLHPWVNPPAFEKLNSRNSFPGNLPREIETAKLRMLTQAITENLGVRPTVYKAGRYGIGANTAGVLRELGYSIDMSVYPNREYMADGGPDFRSVSPLPFWLDEVGGVLEIPLTCAYEGLFHKYGRGVDPLISSRLGSALHIPGMTSRLRMLNRVAITPEGIPLAEAKRLTKSLLGRGINLFTMAFHSSSLEPGSSPYVRSHLEVKKLLQWIEEYLAFFLHEVGGTGTTPIEVRNLALASAVKHSSPGQPESVLVPS